MTPEEKEAYLDEPLPADERTMYYHRDGTPFATRREAFAALERGPHNTRDSHWVAFTRAGTRFVSTVYLCINHSFIFGPPLIFESMAFDNGNFDGSLGQDRYTTEAQAFEGHARMVREVLGKEAWKRYREYGSDPREDGKIWESPATRKSRTRRWWQFWIRS